MVGWSRDEILKRNSQLAALADSRKEVMLRDRINHRAELIELVRRIKDGRLSKSEKKSVLSRLRQLESLTGIDLGNYNSSDFAKDYYENKA